MCGICGSISASPLAPADRDRVARMNAALKHRGPDGEGSHFRPHVALAMRRLSIIDLAGGWQPIFNEDQSLAVVCNEEIYNYLELRDHLQARGHLFTTGSDVETIVHLYEEYGLDFVQHLRGMFAVALWDEPRQRLVLARDRMGEKPLYLFEQNQTLWFASEMKALLQSGVIDLAFDPAAVNDYFHYHYVPEPQTILRGVRKLPAGHLLVVEVDPWGLHESKYWDMLDAQPLAGEPGEILRAVLDDVAELVVRSDVPVGVALSSGLDSSAVAALAVSHYPDSMHAFSVGYPGALENDERAGARDLASHLGMPFHDVEIHTAEMVENFTRLVFFRDDPIADISGFGYYMLQKASREAGIPVMLQGHGGDELFWGYGWVRTALAESRIRAQDSRPGLRTLWASRELALPTGISRAGLGPFGYAMGGLVPTWQCYRRRTAPPDERLIFYDLARDYAQAPGQVAQILSPGFRDSIAGRPDRHFTIDRPWPPLPSLFTKLISQTYLLENGIAQGDRLGMASSVELRLPLLDYKLVETVIGLRKTYDDSELAPKTWLKRALQGVLPPWVFDRPKRGFEPPVREWHAALFARYGQLLVDGILVQHGVLSPEAGQRLAAGPYPKTNDVPISFKALVLEVWAREMQATVAATPSGQ